MRWVGRWWKADDNKSRQASPADSRWWACTWLLAGQSFPLFSALDDSDAKLWKNRLRSCPGTAMADDATVLAVCSLKGASGLHPLEACRDGSSQASSSSWGLWCSLASGPITPVSASSSCGLLPFSLLSVSDENTRQWIYNPSCSYMLPIFITSAKTLVPSKTKFTRSKD